MNTYKKTNWQDSPSTDTPLDAEHLNNIEDGIEAVTESVTALETSKADKVDTYTKVETNNLLSEKENVSNKVDDIDTECTDEEYPSANAVKNYLTYNYYDADEADSMYQHILVAGDNVTITKPSAAAATIEETISVNLDSKYDASNVETGNGELTVYSEDMPVSSATFAYQRTGDFVTVALSIEFSQAEMGKTKSYQLLGLPYKNDIATRQATITNNKNKLTVAIGVGTSTLTVLTQGEAVSFSQKEFITDTITYKIRK